MKKQNNRISRIESDVAKILSEVIAFGLKDPRVGALVSVTRVKLTRDMSYATVYVTGQKENRELLEGLESAKGYLRKKLGEEMTTFRIPELIFKYDDTSEYLGRIDMLLNQVSKKGVTTNTLEEIGNIVKTDSYRKIAVMPHMLPDGDAIGSCVAMYHALRSIGKDAVLVIAERVAQNLRFLLEGVEMTDSVKEKFDLVISLDTGSIEQIRDRRELFEKAPKTISIDHHKTNNGFADIVYVDVNAAATGEIIFDLLTGMGIEFTPEICMAIYSAISTDTGSFKHSNTTAKSFATACKLMEYGFDFTYATNHLYKNMPLRKAEILQYALNQLNIVDGVIALSDILDGPEAMDAGDHDGITDYLLSLQGVEVAVFARRLNEEEIKFSLRSKNNIDVAAVAEKFGGGGHKKASGFVTKKTFDDAAKQVVGAIKKTYEGN